MTFSGLLPETASADDAGAPPHAPVLDARDVHVVRDGRPILQDVSLTVRPGEHWALLGPNGAGKTTLLSLLGALVHPTEGTVRVLGRTLGRVDLRELRTYVGHVNPRHPLRSPLPVREVVLTGLTNSVERLPRWRPTAEQEQRADRLITTLGLAARAGARWPTLSQGERGRALIARALMPSPRLLLLDEPATGLDVAGREQLIDSLDSLSADHPALASVLVTHHLEELPSGTTHAMLLRDGRTLASGPVSEVLTSDRVSTCFAHPVHLTRHEGRWTVRARRVGNA
ncbi:ABC transporter ATP-binding protein [Streptomyces sp. TS71-3]|uniref:ABC transporter ATP-binding protein n=1 Tax=Streptomyces sp. TS71-3 TaxID=2733862 RepID=UPI001B2DD477|nr:ATP-binding cassette domain-containing protein [Streptomyces sp. TS71-3]GHJ36160.1 ABC transporter ATP-binding protein [Streptomyces sp. TS71-3]